MIHIIYDDVVNILIKYRIHNKMSEIFIILPTSFERFKRFLKYGLFINVLWVWLKGSNGYRKDGEVSLYFTLFSFHFNNLSKFVFYGPNESPS